MPSRYFPWRRAAGEPVEYVLDPDMHPAKTTVSAALSTGCLRLGVFTKTIWNMRFAFHGFMIVKSQATDKDMFAYQISVDCMAYLDKFYFNKSGQIVQARREWFW